MKKILNVVLFAVLCFCMGGCGSSKHIAYFQNSDSVDLSASKGLFDARIMPKDLLTITVSTTDPKAATPFNLSVTNTLNSTGTLYTGAGSLQTYLVDNDGFINFPVVGQLKVGGMTKRQCESYIREKILPYMAKTENPIVTVKMASFKVAVGGEVKSPGVFNVDQEKISIIEALARAGDLTIYGLREHVTVMREVDGEQKIYEVNLTSAQEVFSSPVFYLRQNDFIYVEPNKMRANQATVNGNSFLSSSFWVSVASLLVSLGVLIFN